MGDSCPPRSLTRLTAKEEHEAAADGVTGTPISDAGGRAAGDDAHAVAASPTSRLGTTCTVRSMTPCRSMTPWTHAERAWFLGGGVT